MIEFESEREREKTGFLVRKFLGACALAYRRSLKGTLPSWVEEIVGGELGGGTDFNTMPLALVGFSTDGGMVVSNWEVGDGVAMLEHRAWSALLRMRGLREFWTLELRENHRVQLARMLAETWVVDPTPVPPHGVIPGLEIQDWEDAPRELEDGRGLAIFLAGSLAGEWEVVWGPDASADEWGSALARAGEGFAKGKVAVVQALPDRPEKAGRILIE